LAKATQNLLPSASQTPLTATAPTAQIPQCPQIPAAQIKPNPILFPPDPTPSWFRRAANLVHGTPKLPQPAQPQPQIAPPPQHPRPQDIDDETKGKVLAAELEAQKHKTEL
jgi:hypothetical protein